MLLLKYRTAMTIQLTGQAANTWRKSRSRSFRDELHRSWVGADVVR